MSAQKDISRLEFPGTENYHQTDNLKEYALALIQNLHMYIEEQNEWFDNIPSIDQEEIEEIPFDIERPTLAG